MNDEDELDTKASVGRAACFYFIRGDDDDVEG